LNWELGFLNIKFRGNAKFLEVRPIRVVWMALNVEWCDEKKKRKKDLRWLATLEGKKGKEKNL
jgi:hypothetical protein